MKNQKITYLLLFLAVIIWGVIIWKIFLATHVSVKDEANKTLTNVENFVKKDTLINKEFCFNYLDPFLKNNRDDLKNVYDEHIKSKQRDEAKVIRWPDIEYNGTVEVEKKKSKLGFLKIKGKNYLARKMERYAGIIVIDIFQDSILLEYNTYQKCYLKSN